MTRNNFEVMQTHAATKNFPRHIAALYVELVLSHVRQREKGLEEQQAANNLAVFDYDVGEIKTTIVFICLRLKGY